MHDENPSLDTEEHVPGDLHTEDTPTPLNGRDLSRLDFTESIEDMKAKTAAKAAGTDDDGPLLTPEEERTTEVYTIGDRDFYLSSILEWKLKQDEDFCEIVPLVLPVVEAFTALYKKNSAQGKYDASVNELKRQYLYDVEAEHAIAAAEERDPEHVELPVIPAPPDDVSVDEVKDLVQLVMQCITKSNAHRKLLAIAYVPVGEKYDRDRTAEIEEIMGDATNADLIRCIQRFFTICNG